jgi:hypothetical protein
MWRTAVITLVVISCRTDPEGKNDRPSVVEFENTLFVISASPNHIREIFLNIRTASALYIEKQYTGRGVQYTPSTENISGSNCLFGGQVKFFYILNHFVNLIMSAKKAIPYHLIKFLFSLQVSFCFVWREFQITVWYLLCQSAVCGNSLPAILTRNNLDYPLTIILFYAPAEPRFWISLQST